MTDARLERELRQLAGDLDWAATPDAASRIAALLASTPDRSGRCRTIGRTQLRIAAALALALVAAAVSVPPVRATLERAIGIGAGERIERVPARLPRLDLGRPATLAAASAAAGFDVRVPAALGPPDEVRVGGDLDHTAVSLLYGDDVVLTQSAAPSVGIVRKQIGPEVVARPERIGDATGFWIDRGPRALTLLDPELRAYRVRAALRDAGVLLWARDGVAFRLETRRPRLQALEIARSVS